MENKDFDKYLRETLKDAQKPLMKDSVKSFKKRLFWANFLRFSLFNFNIYHSLLLLSCFGLGIFLFTQNNNNKEPFKNTQTVEKKAIIQNNNDNQITTAINENDNNIIKAKSDENKKNTSSFDNNTNKLKNTSTTTKSLNNNKKDIITDTIIIEKHIKLYDTIRVYEKKIINKYN